LRTNIIPHERLSAEGFGEYRPIEDNDSMEKRAKNRRVDIKIFTNEKIKAVKEISDWVRNQ
jgi:chemotaxis protein MotB